MMFHPLPSFLVNMLWSEFADCTLGDTEGITPAVNSNTEWEERQKVTVQGKE